MDVKEEMQEIYEKLQQERDELRVKLNLLQKESRDEWDKVENHWQDLRAKVKHVAGESGKAGDDIMEAVRLLGGEIKQGYKKIRDSI